MNGSPDQPWRGAAGKTLVFVYGTLRQGHGLHSAISHSDFYGIARLDDYVMHEAPSGWFPAIVRRDGSTVFGEIYGVTRTTLRDLDVIEGNGSMYQRTPVLVTDTNGETFAVETYVWCDKRSLGDEIPSGSWPAHLASQD